VSAAFCRLSERLFRPTLDKRILNRRAPMVLVAARAKDSYQLVHGLIATALAAEHDARIVAFQFDDRPAGLIFGRVRTDRNRKNALFSRRNFRNYSAFADEVVSLCPSLWDILRVQLAVRRYKASRPSRRDAESFTIAGIQIGDFAFDTFIAAGHSVSVNPLDSRFLYELSKLSVRALVLQRYLLRNQCCAVVVKDSAYAIGIPARVALHLQIKAYGATVEWSCFFTPKFYTTGLEGLDYPGELQAMTVSERAFAQKLGIEFLNNTLTEGSRGLTHRGADVWKVSGTTLIPQAPQSTVATVLISMHSFTDAQHNGPAGLFTDSFSWLEYIHQVAIQTNYLWLIKLHPDERDVGLGVRDAVSKLFADRDNVHVLDGSVTHGALLNHGIDLALTLYGTIALEYPALGIPVVTARPLNSHSCFSYAINPKTLEEYQTILFDPSRWAYKIRMDEVAESAYLRYLVGGSVLSDVGPETEVVRGFADRAEQFHSAWETLDDARLNSILRLYREWVRSGAYSLNRFAALRNGGHQQLLRDYRRARDAGHVGRLKVTV